MGATAFIELRDGFKVTGTYLNHPITLPDCQSARLDLTDKRAVTDFLNENRPDIILHTAAAVNVDECESNRDLAYRSNVVATETLAEYVEKHEKKLIYISTDAFFDGKDKLFSEEDTPTPMNYYGESKLLGELIVRKRCEDHLIVRTNLYGWNYQNKFSLAEWMLSNITAKKKIPLVYDVHYTPILTNSVVDCLRLLIDRAAQGTFHIAGSRSISKLEFGHLLCKTFDLSTEYIVPSSVKDLHLKAPRSSNMALSIEKLKRALPELKFSLENDLQRFKGKPCVEAFRTIKN